MYFLAQQIHSPEVDLLVLPKGCTNGKESGGSSLLPFKLGDITFAKLHLGKELAGCNMMTLCLPPPKLTTLNTIKLL